MNQTTEPSAAVSAQPTPGPWTVGCGTYKQARVYGHEDVEIAVVSKQDPQCDGGRSTATELANARLIAAAPQLLSEARYALAALEGTANPTAAIKGLRAAIAAATGK